MEAFNELLSIKAFRETRAELAVLKQRHVFTAASEKREADERSLLAFRLYALDHERGLYADLCRRLVRVRDIENVQQEVVVLRDRERSHEETLEQSEQALAAEHKRLEEARDSHLRATRMKQKFVELVQVYSDEELQELERKEDAEMEEVSESRRDRADWDEYHEEAA